MTLHYFQVKELELAQDKRLRAVFKELPGGGGEGRGGRGAKGSSRSECGGGGRGDRGQFTPAMVEQVASEHETVDEFISALEVLRSKQPHF